jgi:hypothetical protein
LTFFVCVSGRSGQLTLAQKGYLAYREDVLWPLAGEREGAIAAVAWKGTLLAWGNDAGVKVRRREEGGVNCRTIW